MSHDDNKRYTDMISLRYMHDVYQTVEHRTPVEISRSLFRAFSAYNIAGANMKWGGPMPPNLSSHTHNSWWPGMDLYLTLEAIGAIGCMRESTKLNELYETWRSGLADCYSGVSDKTWKIIDQSALEAWCVAQRLARNGACLSELVEIVAQTFPTCETIRAPPPGIYPGVFLDLALGINQLSGISHPILETMETELVTYSDWRGLLRGKGYSDNDIASLVDTVNPDWEIPLKMYGTRERIEVETQGAVLSSEEQAAADHLEY